MGLSSKSSQPHVDLYVFIALDLMNTAAVQWSRSSLMVGGSRVLKPSSPVFFFCCAVCLMYRNKKRKNGKICLMYRNKKRKNGHGVEPAQALPKPSVQPLR
jgi:hypothetical protein